MNMMVNTSELVASEAETKKIALKKAVANLVASWEKAGKSRKEGWWIRSTRSVTCSM